MSPFDGEFPQHLQSFVDDLSTFQVLESGVISEAGRFEGQMLYVPLFWTYVLDGMADSDHNGVAVLRVERDDKRVLHRVMQLQQTFATREDCSRMMMGRKAAFDCLKKRRFIRLRQSDAGFIEEV